MVMSRCVGVRIWGWRGRQRSGCKVFCMPFGVMRLASPNDGKLLGSGKAVSWHIMRFWCFDQGHPWKKVWPWEQRMLSLCSVYIYRILKGNAKTIGLSTIFISYFLLIANYFIAFFVLLIERLLWGSKQWLILFLKWYNNLRETMTIVHYFLPPFPPET